MAVPEYKLGTLTQIIYLSISTEHQISDVKTPAGRQWSRALDLVQSCEGLDKLYWGRRYEEPEKLQLHIVWRNYQHSDAFMEIHFNTFRSLVKDMGVDIDDENNGIQARHVTLQHQALDDPFGPSLLGHPIGTAIYKGTDASWHEGAWPLWTHVVRTVDGCRGIAGGSVREPVEGVKGSYVVYVAWETVKYHDDYHHSEHFRRHQVILGIGHQGWTEYGHVVFAEIRNGNGKKIGNGNANRL
ncbi:hypothetical protein M406DRAFT_335193 [Cryphonectria parasitica EP155]|uniref:ABM domain-containing protein n=1 Tax=Cryphonectria parasitica (strain ATCC 38755 / EP155) TaxID=660469 RepID=A0A9P5CJI7_CRYP1|nr:uncharacterized protein M406DRAFT_335193 [Cryphonectria parasitica EP155]KAF3759981.1 hypothetical protein M406DRAFT_335193 [Cryphonectria parasitica EP155]